METECQDKILLSQHAKGRERGLHGDGAVNTGPQQLDLYQPHRLSVIIYQTFAVTKIISGTTNGTLTKLILEVQRKQS